MKVSKFLETNRKMSELTREKRKEIYTEAFKMFEKHTGYLGMCYFLRKYIDDNRIVPGIYGLNRVEFMNLLPEFAEQEPKDHKVYRAYWWPVVDEIYDYKSRAEAFKNMIELCK